MRQASAYRSCWFWPSSGDGAVAFHNIVQSQAGGVDGSKLNLLQTAGMGSLGRMIAKFSADRALDFIRQGI